MNQLKRPRDDVEPNDQTRNGGSGAMVVHFWGGVAGLKALQSPRGFLLCGSTVVTNQHAKYPEIVDAEAIW